MLGVVVIGEHLEFLNRIEGDGHPLKAGDVAGVVHTVERELVGAIARSGERIAKRLRGGGQAEQVQVIAPEERQEIELIAVDPHLDRRRRRIDDGHVGCDNEAFRSSRRREARCR